MAQPDDLVTARKFVVTNGAGALEEAQQRADRATVAKNPIEVVRWSGMADAIAALTAGECCSAKADSRPKSRHEQEKATPASGAASLGR
jgi:hypothetical protein